LHAEIYVFATGIAVQLPTVSASYYFFPSISSIIASFGGSQAQVDDVGAKAMSFFVTQINVIAACIVIQIPTITAGGELLVTIFAPSIGQSQIGYCTILPKTFPVNSLSVEEDVVSSSTSIQILSTAATD